MAENIEDKVIKVIREIKETIRREKEEFDIESFALLINTEINENSNKPEVVTVLKEMGRVVLTALYPNAPGWVKKFEKKFREK